LKKIRQNNGKNKTIRKSNGPQKKNGKLNIDQGQHN